MLVHQAGDFLVLEGLALHDVAPVTGGVADAEQDGFVFVLRLFQRLLAPRVPVYRVMRVLQQVGARLVDEPVSVLMLFLGICIVRHIYFLSWRIVYLFMFYRCIVPYAVFFDPSVSYKLLPITAWFWVFLNCILCSICSRPACGSLRRRR